MKVKMSGYWFSRVEGNLETGEIEAAVINIDSPDIKAMFDRNGKSGNRHLVYNMTCGKLMHLFDINSVEELKIKLSHRRNDMKIKTAGINGYEEFEFDALRPVRMINGLIFGMAAVKDEPNEYKCKVLYDVILNAETRRISDLDAYSVEELKIKLAAEGTI